jgi:hypothetical protein
MKKTTGRAILLILMWLGSFLASSVMANDEGPTVVEPPKELLPTKLNDLRTALLTGENFAQARMTVQVAGRSKDKAYAASLKELANTRSREEWHKLAFDALYSLWLLGEPKTYFLDNAKAFDNNPILAYYSILILSYNPSDEVGGSLPSRVSSKLGANVPLSPEAAELNRSINLVNGALSLFRMVNQMAKTYDATSEPEKKLALLVPYIRVALNAMAEENHEPTSDLDPRAVWAKRQLFLLSEEQPAAVAEGILALRDDIVRQDSVIKASDARNKAYQEYFLRSVGNEAKMKYEELRKASEPVKGVGPCICAKER